MDKILSTFSFKAPFAFSVVPFFLVIVILCSLSCFAKRPDWIRELPAKSIASQSNQSLQPLGVYRKRTNAKTNVFSPNLRVDWNEEIEFFSDGSFEKRFSQTMEPSSKTIETEESQGKGKWIQRENWILLETMQIVRLKCKFSPNSEKKCKETREENKEKPTHVLLYHFHNQSLISLQQESNYQESDFGIAWEISQPFVENKSFWNARKKYALKEFQPHAYFSVKLD